MLSNIPPTACDFVWMGSVCIPPPSTFSCFLRCQLEAIVTAGCAASCHTGSLVAEAIAAADEVPTFKDNIIFFFGLSNVKKLWTCQSPPQHLLNLLRFPANCRWRALWEASDIRTNAAARAAGASSSRICRLLLLSIVFGGPLDRHCSAALLAGWSAAIDSRCPRLPPILPWSAFAW